ncbi:acetylornithine aminotransferase [Allopseudospirillum japonicum]|uniref:Acetylornithine aminotransferase n=1 Tax=Allopseudospirillum japonicum TaxID=64971 RepID=A0A1H6S154_9GAMM|nr:aspartate aminotransferase family protein [Allopseudospirillum japonicum]SEI61639.1 acetylornithine aminotransferase [Allopseudospirillum japonicum]
MTDQALMQTYARLPVAFTHGEGAWLYAENGQAYLDALSGIAVCGLGHAHPVVSEAISQQARRLLHTSNLYQIPQQEALARKLTQITGMQSAFFCNSGTEANEAAIKLARLYGHRKGHQVPHIIVMENAFHGRTLASLSATGNPKAQAGFEPLVEGFIRVPYDNLAAVKAAIQNCAQISAILVEPVQGEGGVHIPRQEYLDGLRTLCDQHDLLLMLDEVQTGNGRTGRMFAFQHHTWLPDVLTTAKGLGNGFPIGAVMVQGKAQDLFQAGSHGTTFGGNPLASAVGLAVLDTLERENLPARAQARGELIRSQLSHWLADVDAVRSIRGLGLMIGVELDRPCTELVKQALDAGLLINVTAGQVVRLLPPLIINEAEAIQISQKVALLVRRFVGASVPVELEAQGE